MPPLLLLSDLDVVGTLKDEDDAGAPTFAGVPYCCWCPRVVNVLSVLGFYRSGVPVTLTSLLMLAPLLLLGPILQLTFLLLLVVFCVPAIAGYFHFRFC